VNKLIQFIIIAAISLYFFGLESKAWAQEDSPDAAIDAAVENAETPDVESTEVELAPDFEVEKIRGGGVKKNCKCEYNLGTAYRDRRDHFGSLIGVQWGAYAPTNYQPSFTTQSYNNYYGGQQSGSIELSIIIKWNTPLGSIGPAITGGIFTATHTDSSVNPNITTTFSVIPVTAGIMYALDTLFKEPYVVPYVVGGMYTGIYNESVGGLSVKGNSAFAPFYSVGAMFQLDWIDPEAHESGYLDYGMENTFLYVEGRSFMQATSVNPNINSDFSTPIQIFAGLRTEF
jgi:hypothetical protein